MILEERSLVPILMSAGAHEQSDKTFQALLPASGLARHQNPDGDVSAGGRRNFVDDAKIVASENRQDQITLGRPYGFEYGLASFGGSKHKLVGPREGHLPLDGSPVSTDNKPIMLGNFMARLTLYF